MNVREQLKCALLDPMVGGISIISSTNGSQVRNFLKQHPESFYLSEWEYELLCRMEYHIHSREKGLQLKALYDENKRGGYPSLVGIYSREELGSLISSDQDTLQMTY
ncbi:hypothetical protein HZA98_03195 [Candidatus Woesearchaeota archaeon]|nr:hypothetical protein [Candidatus Woesearchaeota archaeon]